LRQLHQGLGGHGRGLAPPAREDAVEIAAQGVQAVPPGVAFIRDEFLEDAERRGLAAPFLDLQGAGHAGGMPEVGPLGEETADLQVGIDPRLQLAEDLEDQPIAEPDQRVALIRLEGRRLQLSPATDLREDRQGGRGQIAPPPPEALAALDRGQQLAGEAGLPQRVVEQARASRCTGIEPRHDQARAQPLGVLLRRESEG